MAKIDTSGWKPFAVGDLFDIHPTNAYKMTNAQLMDDGENPVVVNSSYNNGIGGYSSQTITEKGGLITFSDTTTADAIFYQPNDFVGYPHVQGMYPKGKYAANWQESQLLFFVVTFRKAAVLQGFDYAYKFTREIASDMEVLLPVDASGEPDWAYMDEYMSAVMRESEASLENLRQADERKQMFEISNRKEFPIGGEHGLFDVVKGSRLTKAAMREGTINFISASSFNNGIAAHIANTEHVHPGNTLTVSYNGSDIGRTFYQKEPFWASDDVNVLYPRFELNERIALFLAPLIKETGGYHVYKNKWLQTDMMNTMIPLPITEEGNPDWDYMDKYMCALLERTDNNLVELQTVI